MKNFAFPSFRSLLIHPRREGVPPGNATGFVVQTSQGPHLVTNRHVVTGQNCFTKEIKWIPTELKIWHHKKGQIGEWISVVEPLTLDDKPLWREHPKLGEKADFVALPLTHLEDVDLYCYDTSDPWYAANEKNKDVRFLLGPPDVVSIIGFPFGASSSRRVPIWVSGFLASEISENYLDLPIQLVDSRSRPGQSGSPVFAYRDGVPVRNPSGGTSVVGGAIGKFIGIYSGRISENSDIGMVWKVEALDELIKSI